MTGPGSRGGIPTNSTVTNSASVCAARFRSSCDFALTPTRIETATNSKPVRAAAAPRAISANVLHFSKQTPRPNGRHWDAAHVAKDYGPCRLAGHSLSAKNGTGQVGVCRSDRNEPRGRRDSIRR
jgi:hypothetical protein